MGALPVFFESVILDFGRHRAYDRCIFSHNGWLFVNHGAKLQKIIKKLSLPADFVSGEARNVVMENCNAYALIMSWQKLSVELYLLVLQGVLQIWKRWLYRGGDYFSL